MRVRSLDVDGDWQFGKGRNDYKIDNKAISQNIQTRLLSFLGDCFFATDAGLDWFNLLGSKNQLALQLAVNSTILNTDGVTRIVESSASLDETRRITISYKVETRFTRHSSDELIAGETAFLLTESGDVLVTEDGDGIEAG